MKLFRILLLSVILLSGCTAKPVTVNPSAGSETTPDSDTASSNLNVVTPFPEPTRNPDLAVVQGHLLMKGKPFTQGIIYFSKVIQDNSGKDIVVGLDRTSPLNSDLSADGEFKVMNIPPGRYGIVLDLVSHGALLNIPGKKESYLIDVSKGQDLDLGDLNYTDLPVP